MDIRQINSGNLPICGEFGIARLQGASCRLFCVLCFHVVRD